MTVTTFPAVSPLPENNDWIESGSDANAPTISNSGLCGANPSVDAGYFWSISLVDDTLNAFDNLL